jgi:hypothetical protein
MPKYLFDCEVAGAWDGEVEAKNKEEALQKAKEEVCSEGLMPVGEINIERIPKDKQ